MKLVTRITILFSSLQNVWRVKELSRNPKCYFTWKHLELHCGSMWRTKMVVNNTDNAMLLKPRSVYLNCTHFKLVVRRRNNFIFPKFW